jgi:hypothetical protein
VPEDVARHGTRRSRGRAALWIDESGDVAAFVAPTASGDVVGVKAKPLAGSALRAEP